MTDLAFPSVTICSPGLNMEAVKEAILDDFDKWLNETGGNYKEQLVDFMEEKYARKVGEGNIFEQIKAMNSPPSTDSQDCKGCSASLQTLAACTERHGDNRRKISSGGKRGPFLHSNGPKIKDDFEKGFQHYPPITLTR